MEFPESPQLPLTFLKDKGERLPISYYLLPRLVRWRAFLFLLATMCFLTGVFPLSLSCPSLAERDGFSPREGTLPLATI